MIQDENSEISATVLQLIVLGRLLYQPEQSHILNKSIRILLFKINAIL
jgi:hypothetical protein